MICYDNIAIDDGKLILKSAKPTGKLCYRKDCRAMHHVHECPENFRDSLTMPKLFFSKIFHGFVPINPMNVPTKFEVRSFTRS